MHIVRITNEDGQSIYNRACVCFCSLMQFYTLNVVIILFDLTSNSEFSGTHNKHVSLKDYPNASSPQYKPLEHEHIAGNKTTTKKKKSISFKYISNIL